MTDELSVIELIMGASFTVKLVMAILVAASVTSWFMIVQRVIILQRADAELLDFEDRSWSGMDLAQLYREGSNAIEEGTDITGGEALFRAGISPKRQAFRISHKRLSSLVPIIKEILLEAISSGGSSLRDFRNASGDLGYFQHSFDVYGREDQDCFNTECDSKIKRVTQAGRSSFYCSNCQR